MSILAVIPARGGSKGLPGKNVRPLCGLPLIAHSIRLARLCPEVSRTIVTTDDEAIAHVARAHGGDVPFLRPASLAGDRAPMWPVVRHALETIEQDTAEKYEAVLLLDPTSPGRLPGDIAAAAQRLMDTPEADGVIGVSRPEFNPYWHCVVAKDGWMSDLIPGASTYARRQDVPDVFRINASLYLWRAAFVRREATDWRSGHLLMHEVPESRAIHIDDLDEFRRAELMIREGLVTLPWLPA